MLNRIQNDGIRIFAKIAIFILLVLAVLYGALWMLVGQLRPGDPDFAKQVCGYQFDEIQEACLQERFVGQSDDTEFLQYLQAADFERIDTMQLGCKEVYALERHQPKGPQELLMFVGRQGIQISSVKLDRWVDNWRPDPATGENREKSRGRIAVEEGKVCLPNENA